MNTRIVLPIIALAGLLPLVNGCKKKETTPEKPKGVVMCEVNNVAWQSGLSTEIVKIGANSYYKTSATLRNDSFWLTGIRNNTDTSGIYIFSLKLKSGAVGSVTGTTDAFKGVMYLPLYDLNTLIAVLGKYNITYEVNITAKDAVAKTITGSFYISMASSKGNIIISKGEFIEVKYK